MKRLRQDTLLKWLLSWYEKEITTSRLLQLINGYFKEEGEREDRWIDIIMRYVLGVIIIVGVIYLNVIYFW